MAISDIFSSSFLFSVAIIIILIGGIFAYVSYRMGEQDHKLTSMVNLVSILAQDLQFVKSKVNTLQNNSDTTNNLQYSSEMMGGQNPSDLISVSDGENEIDNDDEDDDDDDDDDEDKSDQDNTVNEDDDEDDDEDECVEVSQEHIKLLNLSLANEDVQNDSPIEDLVGDFEELDNHNKEDIKTIHLETPINFEETEIPMPSETDQHNFKVSSDELLGLKNVTITDIGDIDDLHSSKTDYKKMSLNKLREVIVNKGVVVDASKLKKNEILKMLGDE